MTEPAIDYTAVFRALPGTVALLTPPLVYADANEEFLRLAGRTREQLVGHYLPDDFPDKLDDPAVAVRRNIEASLRRVAETGQRDAIALQCYDVEDPDRPGVRDERYWSWINAPIVGPEGRVALLLHRAEEVTELIRAREVALRLQVTTADPATGEAITYRITRHGAITGASHPEAVLSFLRPDQPWDDTVMTSFCHYVQHFTSPATARQWTAEHPAPS